MPGEPAPEQRQRQELPGAGPVRAAAEVGPQLRESGRKESQARERFGPIYIWPIWECAMAGQFFTVTSSYRKAYATFSFASKCVVGQER